MKKVLIIVGFMLLVMGISSNVSAQTTQVDALIEKLVEKNILTRKEAVQLKGEIAADEKMVREETKNQILPEWAQKMKLKGDVRLRHQYERRKNSAESRSRLRARYRLGLISNITNNVEAGAGLASGGDDPRSTNQTLEDSFETPDIRLDYVYGQWKVRDDMKIIGGKFPFKDYLWTPADMLWDSDITTDGIALNYAPTLTEEISPFFNAGFLSITENGAVDRADPFLTYFQGGLKYQKGMADAAVASTYYAFNALKGTCPDWSRGTNSGITSVTTATGACNTGSLTYDYDSVGVSSEFGLKKPFGGLPLGIDSRIAFFGDFIYNPDPESENAGWAFGVKFGSEALKTPGDWQMKYARVVLELDAWPDFMPDSDRLGGNTNVISHEAALEYIWKENITLGIDYYNSDNLIGAKNREQLVQGDVVFKF